MACPGLLTTSREGHWPVPFPLLPSVSLPQATSPLLSPCPPRLLPPSFLFPPSFPSQYLPGPLTCFCVLLSPTYTSWAGESAPVSPSPRPASSSPSSSFSLYSRATFSSYSTRLAEGSVPGLGGSEEKRTEEKGGDWMLSMFAASISSMRDRRGPLAFLFCLPTSSNVVEVLARCDPGEYERSGAS